MTEVFRLCDDYLTRWAALDPVAAGMVGLSGVFGAATDYGPDGFAAREELIATTLAALGAAPVTSQADRRAASFLRERLEAQLAWHRTGEPLRLLRTPIGQLSAIRDSVDLLPRDGEESWRNIEARLAAFPAMFASWRSSLDAGLRQRQRLRGYPLIACPRGSSADAGRGGPACHAGCARCRPVRPPGTPGARRVAAAGWPGRRPRCSGCGSG